MGENAQRKDKKTFLQINSHSGITVEENLNLYDAFVNKLRDSIYQYRPANPEKILIKEREQFEKLSMEEQCVVLGEVLHLFQCKPLVSDLRLIGASSNTGKVQIGKKITNCSSVKELLKGIEK